MDVYFGCEFRLTVRGARWTTHRTPSREIVDIPRTSVCSKLNTFVKCSMGMSSSENRAPLGGLGRGGIQILNEEDLVAVLPIDKLVNEVLRQQHAVPARTQSLFLA